MALKDEAVFHRIWFRQQQLSLVKKQSMRFRCPSRKIEKDLSVWSLSELGRACIRLGP